MPIAPGLNKCIQKTRNLYGGHFDFISEFKMAVTLTILNYSLFDSMYLKNIGLATKTNSVVVLLLEILANVDRKWRPFCNRRWRSKSSSANLLPLKFLLSKISTTCVPNSHFYLEVRTSSNKVTQ